MLSRSVQLAFNQFAIDTAQAKGINLEVLASRLAFVNNDNTANHILNNYASGYRYSLATRQKENTSIGWIYTTWKYYDLITGALITDVVFLNGLNELEVGDLVKIIYIKPKLINIFPGGDGDLVIIPTKKVWSTSMLVNESTHYTNETNDNEASQKAGFDFKSLLIPGLIAAGIYMLVKK